MPGGTLTDAALFQPTVPATWQPLAELIGSFAELVLAPAPEAPDAIAARRGEAARLRAAMLVEAAQLRDPTPDKLLQTSAEHRRWFTEAALLSTHFAAAGGAVVMDSLGSTTLRYFTPDLPDDETARAAVRRALMAAFGWREDELAEVEQSVARRISNLDVRRAIAAYIAQQIGRPADRGELEARTARLVRRIYGALPLRPGDVDLVLTTTTVMVCLPYRGKTLERPDFAGRPRDEVEPIVRFLERVESLKSSFETVRFPAFGLLERDGIDPTLITELTAHARTRPGLDTVSEAVVADSLYTMVSLIPSGDAEMLLVHDIWGHGWEEMLCDFEWSYAKLTLLRDHVGLGTRQWTDAGHAGHAGHAGKEQSLRDAFTVVDGRAALDEHVATAVVRADLRDRITTALNVVFAEFLADVVEHKYVRSRPAEAPALPSSSLMPEAPAKLDLSLRDVQTLLRAAHRPYRRLIADAAEATRLESELARAGLPEAGRSDAVKRLIRMIEETPGLAFDTGFGVRQAVDDKLSVSLATRAFMSLAATEAALQTFLEAAPRASIDLLVLLLGWFYEQDRAVHFWHMDELLRHELPPGIQRFERALADAVAAR